MRFEYDKSLHYSAVDNIVRATTGPNPMPSNVDELNTAEFVRSLVGETNHMKQFIADLAAAVRAADKSLTAVSSTDPVCQRALNTTHPLVVIRPVNSAGSPADLERSTFLIVTPDGLRYGGQVTVEDLAAAQEALQAEHILLSLVVEMAIGRIPLLLLAHGILVRHAEAEDKTLAKSFLALSRDRLDKVSKQQPESTKEYDELVYEVMVLTANLEAIAAMLAIGDLWKMAQAELDETTQPLR